MNNNARIVALDVGTKRIGVASASVVARLAAPLQTLDVTEDITEQIKQLLESENAVGLVIGLPRGMQGQDTAQTESTRQFVAKLRQHVSIPVYWQDEAVTSVLSEAALQSKKGGYNKGDVDAMAASLILEDFLATNQELSA